MKTHPAVTTAGLICVTALFAVFPTSCGGRAPSEQSTEAVLPSHPNGLNRPLQSFSQEITSEIKLLKLKPSSTVEVPVVVKNTTDEVLSSIGKHPVNISYRWFDGPEMLPIEGERTLFHLPLPPGATTKASVKVVAPASKGKALVLKISLVQEGVDWFLSRGAAALEIPAIVE